jgi:hypothetical protein
VADEVADVANVVLSSFVVDAGLGADVLVRVGTGEEPVHAWATVDAPSRPTIKLRSLTAAVIALGGGIRHVVDGSGRPVDAALPNDVVPGFSSSARLEEYDEH